MATSDVRGVGGWCKESAEGVVSWKLIRMHKDLDIGVQGELDEVQATQHLAQAWKTLRGVQKDSEKYI